MRKEAKILKLHNVKQDTSSSQNDTSKLLRTYYQELLNLDSMISDVVGENTIQARKSND